MKTQQAFLTALAAEAGTAVIAQPRQAAFHHPAGATQTGAVGLVLGPEQLGRD